MIPRGLVVIAVALVAAMPLLPGASAKDPVVTVLVDFGDGTYRWTDVVVPQANRTALKATEIASAALVLAPPNVTWFDSSFCVRRPCAFVNDIGERRPVYPAWWHLFLWGFTSTAWEPSRFGPSDTDLSDGAVIAWYLAVDDSVTSAAPLPVPRVDFRYVHASFRGDLRNRGVANEPLPDRVRLTWDVDVGVREIDTTPVVAFGRVFVATRNALVALNAFTGEQAWRNPAVHSLLSTPAIYDDHLILGGTDGKLHSVWASNGTEAWNVQLQPGTQSTGIASSPAVFEGRAYVGTFNETVNAAPAFTLTDIDGNVLDRAALDGYVVVLEFSGTWCSPCGVVRDALLELWPQYQVSNIIFLSVYVPPADDPSSLASYRVMHNIPWHMAQDTDNLLTKFGVSAIPRVFVMDARGVVAADWTPPIGFTKDSAKAELSADIDQVLRGWGSRIASVNLNDGTIAWTYEVASVHMSAPAIANASLYLGVMGMYDGAVGYRPPYGILALGLDGSRKWFYATDGPVASSPVVWNGTVYATDKAANLYALDTDGALAWRQPLPGSSTSSPSLVGDAVYAASGGVGGTGAVASFTFGGQKRWERSVGGAVQASLTSDGRLVCGATNVANGSYFCLATSDGAVVWSYTPLPHDYILGSLAAVGGRLYAPSDNGHVYAFEQGFPPEPAAFPWGFVAMVVLFLLVLLGVPLAVFLMARRRRRPPHA